MTDARFSTHAYAELRNDTDFYNMQYPGRGDRFADAVEATVAVIRRNPKIGTPYRKGYRKRKVPKFPHSIFYYEYPTYIWVQAVYHGSRKPDGWMNRDLPQDDPA